MSKSLNNIRVRMAPSPTGFLHVGTAMIALFNYLFAKKNNGVFVLRMEDTDSARSEKKFEQDIFDGLKWLGIESDEGPDTGGDFAPYYQSKRSDIYQKYLEMLLKTNNAYHCFCTQEVLKKQRDILIEKSRPIIYQGTCTALSMQEVKNNLDKGIASVIRFRVPKKKVTFTDLIKGEISFDTSLTGDIVIAKNIKTPLYNFAVVVDDATMQITHVIRGEDHISNTPKQILLYEALKFTIPTYAHIPLILAPDKSKLSKRYGAIAVIEYKKEGYLPEVMINFLVLLGWNDGTDKEVFSIKELKDFFDIEKVHKSGAVFDVQKLEWLNSHYLRQKSIQELTRLCLPYIMSAGLGDKNIDVQWFEKIVALERERMKKLSDIISMADFFFTLPEYEASILIWKKSTKENTLKSLRAIVNILDIIDVNEFIQIHIKEALIPVIESTSNGEVYWPMRVALSGKKASPGPIEIAEILGKEETLRRMQVAVDKLNTHELGIKNQGNEF